MTSPLQHDPDYIFRLECQTRIPSRVVTILGSGWGSQDPIIMAPGGVLYAMCNKVPVRVPSAVICWILIPLQGMGSRAKAFFIYHLYTLSQKKRNFNLPIFPGYPGFLTLAQGHADFVKWS